MDKKQQASSTQAKIELLRHQRARPASQEIHLQTSKHRSDQWLKGSEQKDQDLENSERERTHSAMNHRSPQHQTLRLSMAEETSPLRVLRGVKESQNKVLDKSRRPRDVSHRRIRLLRMSRDALSEAPKTRWS